MYVCHVCVYMYTRFNRTRTTQHSDMYVVLQAAKDYYYYSSRVVSTFKHVKGLQQLHVSYTGNYMSK